MSAQQSKPDKDLSFWRWMNAPLSRRQYRNLWIFTLLVLVYGTALGIGIGLAIWAVARG